MMKKLIMAGIAMLTIAISSCDNETDTLGNTLTSSVDRFAVAADTFNVTTRSIVADSVLARSVYSYLGRLKDPETGAYVTSDYMTQFNLLESTTNSLFFPADSIVNRDEHGLPVVDSCVVNIVTDGYQGDTLTAMKVTVRELEKAVKDGVAYYSNYDPETLGYLRSGEGAVNIDKVYSYADLLLSDSVRKSRMDGKSYPMISIPLNDTYTDRNGRNYNNYGTYIMQQYYEHPEYFKNALTFTKNICPGLYFKTTGGLGLVMEVLTTRLDLYYTHKYGGSTTSNRCAINGSEEVLRTIHITNDKNAIRQLADDKSCTYLKTPAGIFTEVTLPVDDIMKGHENDTITQAKIVFRRMNDFSSISDIVMAEPPTLLMIERDSLNSFFEHRNVPDYVSSYLAYFNSTYNTYTFNNIAGLITHMHNLKERSANWNKVVIVPVDVTTTSSSSSSSSTSIANIDHLMFVTSIRLIGGEDNQHDPVRLSVTYSKPN